MKVAAVAIACVAIAPPAAVAPVAEPVPVVAPPARGGHAHVPPSRGGHAAAVLEPIGPLSVWVCIHGHEAAWNDAGDPYWGGLQMDRGFVATYGADKVAEYGGLPDVWPPREQMVVAWRAVVGYHGYGPRGYGPWPNTRHGCA